MIHINNEKKFEINDVQHWKHKPKMEKGKS
jgi:hypothetical protein